MSDDNDDKVGYGRPPKTTRFKPGQSGNPRGRPRGSVGLKSIIARLARRTVTQRDGRKILLLEAILNAQAVKAEKGDTKAAQFSFGVISAFEDPTPSHAPPQFSEEDRRILIRCFKRIEEDGRL